MQRKDSWSLGWGFRPLRDYEYLPSSSECMVQLTMIRLMVKRLARATETARETAQRLRAA